MKNLKTIPLNFICVYLCDMKINKQILIVIGIVMIALPATAQNKASFQFEQMSKDIGEVREEKGVVNVSFPFKNIGKDTLKITYIKPSSMALNFAYSKTVPPGSNGSLAVTFNPKGMTGKFSLSMVVYANTIPFETVMVITGIVNSKNAGPYQKFPSASGNLRSTGNLINFSEIYNTAVVTDTIFLYNNWKKTMHLSAGYIPETVTKIAFPKKMKTHKSGLIIITYSAAKKNDWGLVQDKIEIKTDDTLSPIKYFSLVANITEDFTLLTPEQRANAAQCKVDSATFNFGSVTVGDVVKHDFIISNTGKSVLILRKVKASCGCTVPFVEKNEILPGESGKISAEFSTRGRSGWQSKVIHVICNDPYQQSFTLTLEGNIK
ncbi:MAG: DUF1573 domain-containing protein [Bacteroidota bacterium]